VSANAKRARSVTVIALPTRAYGAEVVALRFE
jgi:hypothetical protein